VIVVGRAASSAGYPQFQDLTLLMLFCDGFVIQTHPQKRKNPIEAKKSNTVNQ
jgi:hypothetical protein